MPHDGAIARSTLAAALVLAMLVVLAAGCGKSKPKTATDWANDVCSSVADWTTSIGDATDSLKNGNVNKDSVQNAVDDAKDATDKLTRTSSRSASRPYSPAHRRSRRSRSSRTRSTPA